MRWLEWLLLFGGVPLILRWWVPPDWWPYLLAAIAVPGLLAVWRRRAARRRWLGRARPAERARLRPMLLRFAACAAGLLLAIGLLSPERLFYMPLERTALWAVLLATYPVFSVYPQELVYRHLFRRRYRRLFPGRTGWIVASAVAFAWLHIVFDNWLAVALTLIAGLFFAHTYLASGSLRLAIVEHTLYGALVFTVGIGEFFYHDAIGPSAGGTAVAGVERQETRAAVAPHVAAEYRRVGLGQIDHDQPVQRIGERGVDVKS